MSQHLASRRPKVNPTPQWYHDLPRAADIPWLWRGYLAHGNITLLTSQLKAGKTTLTAAGLAILVLHHPRKKESQEGKSARGSGVLSGHVDILVEMHWTGRASRRSRHRKLLAWSRYEDTPRRRPLELAQTRHARRPHFPDWDRPRHRTVPLHSNRDRRKVAANPVVEDGSGEL